MENKGFMRKTMEAINTFCLNEYRTPANFADLGKVGMMYTSFGDFDQHAVQVTANLVDKEILYEVDGEWVATDHYDSYEAMFTDMFWNDSSVYLNAAITGYSIHHPEWENNDQLERDILAAEEYRDWLREYGGETAAAFRDECMMQPDGSSIPVPTITDYYNQGVF